MNEKLVLTIELDQVTGQINVNGPIGNKILCYGMLESAKDAIRDNITKAQRPSIVPAVVMPFGKNHA